MRERTEVHRSHQWDYWRFELRRDGAALPASQHGVPKGLKPEPVIDQSWTHATGFQPIRHVAVKLVRPGNDIAVPSFILTGAPVNLAGVETERLAFRSPQVLTDFPRVSRPGSMRPYQRDVGDRRLRVQIRPRLCWANSGTCVCGSAVRRRRRERDRNSLSEPQKFALLLPVCRQVFRAAQKLLGRQPNRVPPGNQVFDDRRRQIGQAN